MGKRGSYTVSRRDHECDTVYQGGGLHSAAIGIQRGSTPFADGGSRYGETNHSHRQHRLPRYSERRQERISLQRERREESGSGDEEDDRAKQRETAGYGQRGKETGA